MKQDRKGRLLFVLLAGVPGWAQEAPPLFTASTNSVQVDAAVTNDQRPVADLQLEDFLLLDNGQPRAITGIARDELPLDIVLVCQLPIRGRGSYKIGGTTSSMDRDEVFLGYGADPLHRDIPQRLMNAAADAVMSTRPSDRVAIAAYGRDPRIELRFTDDRKAMAAAIKRLGNPENGDENIVLTSEALAIEYAVRMLADVERGDPNARTDRRRLIVLISNVFSVGTRYADEPIIRRLWAQNIILSVIDDTPATESTKSVQRSSGGESQTILFQRYNPIRIAQATGGDRIVALDPQHPGDLLTPIRQRYTLSFNQPPDVSPGKSRTIKVDLSAAAHRRFPGAVVKAREGYVTH
jgi:VWFA-related protein